MAFECQLALRLSNPWYGSCWVVCELKHSWRWYDNISRGIVHIVPSVWRNHGTVTKCVAGQIGVHFREDCHNVFGTWENSGDGLKIVKSHRNAIETVRKYLYEYRSRSFKKFRTGHATMPPPVRFLTNLIEFPLLYFQSQNIIHHSAQHVVVVVSEGFLTCRGINLSFHLTCLGDRHVIWP
jgi:hypothetical protein